MSWLHEECHDVIVEPPLQWLTGEAPVPASSNRRDDVRADIHARGFWGRRQGAFFDIRVFHPNAPNYHQTQVGSGTIIAIQGSRPLTYTEHPFISTELCLVESHIDFTV